MRSRTGLVVVGRDRSPMTEHTRNFSFTRCSLIPLLAAGEGPRMMTMIVRCSVAEIVAEIVQLNGGPIKHGWLAGCHAAVTSNG